MNDRSLDEVESLCVFMFSFQSKRQMDVVNGHRTATASSVSCTWQDARMINLVQSIKSARSR